MLRDVTAIRYVTPLREGGSLPGLMEADDLGTYVVKFRGAGQGLPVLVAEVVAAHLARALGLPVPELVRVYLAPAFAAAEPDEEVQDLLRRSAGWNLGVDFLPGALDADRTAVARGASPALAGRVLWFDAFVGNVDRTWRNPNMLWWGGGLHLIDHGATLTFHHHWAGAAAAVSRPYDAGQHVMAGSSPDLAGAEAAALEVLSAEVFRAAVDEVPDGWLVPGAKFSTSNDLRDAYVRQLEARLAARDHWRPS